MRCEKCKWDGNLDGRLLRCHDHQQRYLAERKLRKQFAEELERQLKLL